MKRILFLMGAFLLIQWALKEKQIVQVKEEKKEYIVSCTRSNGEIQEIPLEDYIIGVVSAEMPASFELEALKAQAICARTFVLSRDLQVDDTTASQVYQDENQRKAKWQDNFEMYETKIKEAVQATQGEVLMYEGNYISALFFSSSHGKTENNEDYFNSTSVPYLRSVSSIFEDPIVEYETISKKQLENIYQSSTIQVLNYTEGGSVNEVQIGDHVYSGRNVREKLGLNSSSFEIEITDNDIIFTTYGYGHGVGMSQYGANGMAKEGFNYRDILSHYYQNTSINQLK